MLTCQAAEQQQERAETDTKQGHAKRRAACGQGHERANSMRMHSYGDGKKRTQST